MARSLARHQSTAVINDRAGERLTEEVMEGMDERERREDEDAAPSSIRLSRNGGRSEGDSGRSEERRVGKEGRYGGSAEHVKKKGQ